MKKPVLVFSLICLASILYGQNTSVTNNNTITIQGNVYYFQPSNTASSPLPAVGSSDFIGTGSWYGENAARAWASIADWAVERCISSSSPVRGNNNERVYISQVHAYRKDTQGDKQYIPAFGPLPIIGSIAIYYWIVRNGDLMENGSLEKRVFTF
jgi:hypothetical protein